MPAARQTLGTSTQSTPPTLTKRELILMVAEATGIETEVVRTLTQVILDTLVEQLGKGRRVEFRDFGIFDVRHRRGRQAHNPKTLEPVEVKPTRAVRFKAGRLMKAAMCGEQPAKRKTTAASVLVEAKLSGPRSLTSKSTDNGKRASNRHTHVPTSASAAVPAARPTAKP